MGTGSVDLRNLLFFSKTERHSAKFKQLHAAVTMVAPDNHVPQLLEREH